MILNLQLFGGRGSKSGTSSTAQTFSGKEANGDEEAQQFGGTATGYRKMEYTGDGSKEIDFFKNNSNAYELMDSMDSATKAAFINYGTGHYMRGQIYRGYDTLQDWEKAEVHAITKTLDKAVLKKGVVVCRAADAQFVFGKGKTTATLDEFKAAKGRVFPVHAFASSGAAKEGLDIGGLLGSTRIEYRIHVPPSKGAGMWTGDRRLTNWGSRQREFLFNRDGYFRVGSSRNVRGRTVVDVEWVGLGKHDYGKSSKP